LTCLRREFLSPQRDHHVEEDQIRFQPKPTPEVDNAHLGAAE
jgi:hypothetical protein